MANNDNLLKFQYLQKVCKFANFLSNRENMNISDNREQYIDYLAAQGYPDFAFFLSLFKLELSHERYPIARIHTKKRLIQMYIEVSLPESSIILRHEFFHRLLKHISRTPEQVRYDLWNIACDFELSHFYTEHDIEILGNSESLLHSALSVYYYPIEDDTDFQCVRTDFYGKKAEEIYEILCIEHPQQKMSIAYQNPINSELPESDALEIDGELLIPQSVIDEIAEQYNIQNQGVAAVSGKLRHRIGAPLPEIESRPAITFLRDLKSNFSYVQHFQRGRTFRRPNKKYAESNVIIRARTAKPQDSLVIACYVDSSGSMSLDKTQKVIDISRVLKNIRRVRVIVFYFNTEVYAEYQESQGGTSYDAVLLHAQEHGYRNIIILTDTDGVSIPDSRNYSASFDRIWVYNSEKGSSNIYKWLMKYLKKTRLRYVISNNNQVIIAQNGD
jgi:predicted metal-dependent peptidase